MLEQPNLPDEKISACLQREYGLTVDQITFLPLGADLNTAVYRVDITDNRPYFLKLRGGVFEPASVLYPKLLSDRGLTQIIPPIPTNTDQLWGSLDAFKTILYPFVEGRNGYEVRLSDQHWQEFGSTLRTMHEIDVPPAITNHVQIENYSSQWRESVKASLARTEGNVLDASIAEDPIAQKLIAYLNTKRSAILELVDRAERLAQTLQAQPRASIVCHADLHAGNVLIDDNGRFYLVDWDTLKLAPKERDLMYVGGGLMAGHRSPATEEMLFYQGYGETQIDPIPLAYYRYERIIEDLAIYCEWLLLTDEGGEDREQSLRAFQSNFRPNGTIEIAYQADKM